MSVRYDPPRPLPPGHRRAADVAREIEEAEGLTATGFHFSWEPGTDEIEEIRKVHEDKPWAPCPPGHLVVREIVTGGERRSWTLFRRGGDKSTARAIQP